MGLNWTPVIVTRGLDPRVHLFRKKLDCRVKPGNDEQGQCKRKLPVVSQFIVRNFDDECKRTFATKSALLGHCPMSGALKKTR
jgi:hypothetical protein